MFYARALLNGIVWNQKMKADGAHHTEYICILPQCYMPARGAVR